MKLKQYGGMLERLKDALGVKSQIEIANAMGISHSAVSHAIKHRRIPDTWKVVLVERYNVNPLWVAYGGKNKKYLLPVDKREVLYVSRTTKIQRHSGESNMVREERIPGTTVEVSKL